MPPRRLRLAITGPRLAITATDSGATIELIGLAGERLAAAPRGRRWSVRTRRLAWAAAVLLHAAVLALALLVLRHKPPSETPSSADVAVVFDNGGEQKTTAPPADRHGPESVAQAPPPAAPPPPAAQSLPDVRLNMPDTPFADIQSAPETPLVAQPKPVARPSPRPTPPRKYVVMNDMSYGNPSPPEPNARPAMNLSLPQTDTQAVMGSDFTVKGNIGADYMAVLHKWVEAHGYYPNAASAQDQEGNAVVEFTVDRSGHVTGAHLLQSSGSPFIDQAWFQLFADNDLPPFPPGTKADHVTVDYTGEFQLIR